MAATPAVDLESVGFVREPARTDWLLLGGLGLFTFAIHLALYKGYGFFRDELYFIACGNHLAWGYVDQPPGVAFIAWFSRKILGDNLFAIRFFPCVFAALQVLLTGLTVRALGGRRFAQAFACVCVIAAPAYFGSYLNTDMFMQLGWAACAWVAARILAGESSKLWLLFGLFAGLALQGKHAMAFFGIAFVIGLLIAPQRKILFSPWIWAGAAITFLIALPNILWEAQHNWATYELLHNIANSDKNVVLGPVQYLLSNVLYLSPLTLPVWLAGLYWFLFAKDGERFRALGWTWVISFILFVALKGKDYYLAPVYPMLFAGGAVAIENFLAASPDIAKHAWLKPTFAAIILLGGIVLWPFAMPMMSVEKFIAYEKALGAAPKKTENTELNQLPQQYADMFGWPEMAKEVARVYNTLPPEDRGKCGIGARNYGEAGAIDYFGRQYGLPPVVSGHQNYWLWGPLNYTGQCMVILGRTKEQLETSYGSVTYGGETYHPYAMPSENHRQIWICRAPKYTSLKDAWPRLKIWL
jgi:hypothetical protein